MSTSSSIQHDAVDIAFQAKDGRRLANDKNIAYILPSDELEVDRLKLNHEMWKLYKSKIHEQLEKGIRVLDIGCGPGWWTLDMARLYPNSQFVGIDMADVFQTSDVPSNVTFQICNASTGLKFENESFSFVFQRFLVMGFPVDQYLQSVDEMKRVLKPGGAIEIIELVNDYKNAGPAFTKIGRGSMDSFIADKISGFLNKAGFVDIQDINYDVPIGAWGGEAGEMFLAIQKMALPAVKVMVTELTSITSVEYDETVEQAFKEADTHRVSTRFRQIYGRKP
ncbi:S-adenosyl-L-methionine-dependent methyltransferase [Radiomyces spectabilis]|uniref:S-adenosyl-L-methionine-dependent methyltransferase n=1 Tax=Radiomyces spectabilis TaxID=64574 RepID=UPI00221EFBD3|nr:S-adenosyl-L-methionine-dependent methyltransferase [Radiomyces spectabilis]KAI8388510.1 S-adenosyl-L-methionine-dependent methyltransferase [Radiomyces spectabilis]